MAGKIQLPAIGGFRKVIKIGDKSASLNPGTTIREFANQIITLAQLKAALGFTAADGGGSGGGGSGVSAALIPGPGLSGGGSLVGAVPLNLTLPLPLIPEDNSLEEHVPVPGPQGFAGPQGAPGTVMLAENTSDVEVIYPVQSPHRTIKAASWLSPGSPNVVYVYCPTACSIMAVRVMTAGGPGNCVIDIWKDSFGSFPPLVGDSITAAAKPTISAGIKYEDTTLTGWTRNINAGDVLAFNIDSSSTFTQIDVALEVQE